jgi:hypothetical protein
MSIQRGDISWKLVYCLLKYFYYPGKGFGVRLEFFPGLCFVFPLLLPSGDGVDC